MRRRDPQRRLVVFLALAAVALASPAAASDRFGDVAPGSVHHDSVGTIVDAGITSGCGGDRYCPRDPVSREQMASFLARTASRSVSASNVTELTSANGYDGVPATVRVRSTGTDGGEAAVSLTATVSVLASGSVSSCPCEVEAFIYRESDDAQGPSAWTQLPGETSGSGRAVASVALNWVAQMPSGATDDYHVAVFLNDGDPSGVEAEATLTAVSTPLS